MPLTIEEALGQKLMLTFTGLEPSATILATLGRQHVGGVTLFRAATVESPAPVRGPAGALRAVAGTPPFPGSLAWGATGDPELARRAGYAVGRELAAMGINVNYAPGRQIHAKPAHPAAGPRPAAAE